MTNNTWRFISSGKMAPAANMAMDEAILEGVIKGVSPQTVRVYDWKPPTISFGFHQDIDKQIDIEKVKKYGFGIVRRPTGGRAVLHYDEVTYAVIAKIDGVLRGSILESYQKIGRVLVKTLNEIGISAEMENGMLTSKELKNWASPCFASASKYEIHYNHKKIIGSAQLRKNNVLLQHGSILLNNNQELLAEFMPNLSKSACQKLKNFLSKKTTAINEILKQPIDFWTFVYKLKKHFESELSINFSKSYELNDSEKVIYQQLLSKYEK